MSERLRGSAVNAPAFIRFVKKCNEIGVAIHSFRFLRDSELVAAADFAPYTGKEKMHVYSLSKAFTSAAVGIAVDEGILSLDEKVPEIFPDKMPDVISENLSKATLRDILTMQSGHPRCVLDKIIENGDSLKTFFASEFTYEPGTTFIYSTAGTMVCGAAVTRRSGEALDEYLDKRLFSKLGIEKPYWEKTADGICYGGVGLRVGADDVAKFGQMLLNGGVYNGVRFLSDEYIKDASSSHALDVNNGSADWVAGYGYQLWLNNKSIGGYRGDGAFGQLCIVLPEQKEVFVMLCECNNMQTELDAIFDYMKESRAADDTDFEEAIALTESTFAMPRTDVPKDSIHYICGVNHSRIFGISLVPEGDRLVMELDCDFGKQRIVCGNGEYVFSSIASMCLAPAIIQLHRYGEIEPFNVYSAFTNENGVITVTMRHSDLPHAQKWIFEGDKLKVVPFCGGLLQTDYSLRRI